jgi:UDP-glucose 4-epimerase
LQNKQCYINGGDQSRDFVYVKDVVNALILAQKAKNEIYNIGTSNDISIINLYEKIRKLTNSNLTPEYKPSIKGEVVKSQLSSKKIKEQIGWTPKISLNDGILETIEYFKNVK